MSARRKINEAELRRLLGQGLSTAQIAAHFDVQSPAVTRACRILGLSLPRPKVEPSRAQDERDLDIIRRVLAGEGFQAVTFRYQMSNVTVQKILKAVEAADIAESGEPVMAVAKAYKRRKPGGRK